MVRPKVYADFHNGDADGRLRLSCVGTIEDLARQGITLCEGMFLTAWRKQFLAPFRRQARSRQLKLKPEMMRVIAEPLR
jgi:hypothetical protein